MAETLRAPKVPESAQPAERKGWTLARPLQVCLLNDSFPPVVDGVANVKVSSDPMLLQRAAEALLGMKQPQYFRYEQGYRDFPTDLLIRLADLYNTSIDYLLGRTDDPRRSR